MFDIYYLFYQIETTRIVRYKINNDPGANVQLTYI